MRIEVANLGYSYGSLTALRDVSFTLKSGEIMGLLGPNGAGKSTTLAILAGILRPAQGAVRLDGAELYSHLRQLRRRIGFLPDQPPLYNELTVNEYLDYAARLRGMSRRNALAARQAVLGNCDLQAVAQRLIRNLSTGYRQRVGIAQALIHNPDFVILDEPTVGLDPVQLNDIRNLIKGLAGRHTVILSTHILNEVQSVCDTVNVINNGSVAFSGSLGEMQEQGQVTGVSVVVARVADFSALLEIAGVGAVETLSPTSMRIEFAKGQDCTDAVVAHIVNAGWQLRELVPLRHSLEQVFIDIVTRPLPVAESRVSNDDLDRSAA